MQKISLRASLAGLALVFLCFNANAQLTTYSIIGGGSLCSGDPGVDIALSGSDAGVSYQLYDGGTAIGGVLSGTGSSLDFGFQNISGTYTIVGNPGDVTQTTMTGSVSVVVNPLPNVYTIAGGGGFCAGGTGSDVFLSSSDAGINYQLYLGGSPLGAPIAGTGSSIDFGFQTVSGSYTISAADATSGCTIAMSGIATVTSNPLPSLYTVTGGGAFCADGSGADVSLSASDAGIYYQLYNSGSAIGAPIAGSGSSIDFGLQTVSGSYTITATDATSGCTGNMSGSATIVANPLPSVYTTTGGGSFCAGGTGIDVLLSNSDAGIDYQLINGGSAVGGLAGTGSSIDFGLQTVSGSYTITAKDATTGCINTMSGSATIYSAPLPAIYSVSGGGSYCYLAHIAVLEASNVKVCVFRKIIPSVFSQGGTGLKFLLQV